MSEDRRVLDGGPFGSYIVEEHYTNYRQVPYLVYEISRLERGMNADEQRKLLKAAERITKGRFKIHIPLTARQEKIRNNRIETQMKKLYDED